MNKKIIKNILSLISIPFFGFILLNITFILNALFYFLVTRIINVIGIDGEMHWYFIPSIIRFCFLGIIIIISYFIFHSKLKTIFKAIFLVVPLATTLVTIGIFLYHWPIIIYSLGFLLVLSSIYYFYQTKQPWIYYYSVILTSLVLAIFFALGGDI
ncbi:MAG TPA: hypothetical protein PKL13_00745 [bacterium]|nr:hypothetical protein [bacterium]